MWIDLVDCEANRVPVVNYTDEMLQVVVGFSLVLSSLCSANSVLKTPEAAVFGGTGKGLIAEV